MCAAAVPAPASAPVLVRFSADDFWLNLHHFLYVLGRAQAGMRDAARPEVAGAPWPADGYSVHVCAYTNWAGAYSTTGPLLVIASGDDKGRGPAALETVFHEASHQWDEPILTKLIEIGKTMNKRVSGGLTHAMIWMTAGEAVRRLIPGYGPLAEAGGLWKRGANPTLKPSLDEAWRPYLDGRGTRDEALKAVMTLVANVER